MYIYDLKTEFNFSGDIYNKAYSGLEEFDILYSNSLNSTPTEIQPANGSMGGWYAKTNKSVGRRI